MNFRQAFELTSDHTKSSPLRREIRLAPGKITKVDFHFPAGCAGLVGARVLRGSFQLWPLTAGQWIVTSGETPTMPETFLLNERPYSVTFEGYNEDIVNHHTITVAVAVEIPDVISEELLEVFKERIPLGLEDLISNWQIITENSSETVTVLTDEMLPLLRVMVELEEEKAKIIRRNMSTEELSRM